MGTHKQVDPDELSPNMRLGLPDESRYDLDRLMYSPDSNTKNSFANKKSKKDMLVDRLENYNEDRLYADENERQSAIDASLFVEKRKRTDKKDEYSIAKPENKVFSDRIVGLSKGRKKRVKRSALAKLKFKPKARPAKGTPGSPTGTDDGGRGTHTKDIVIQVEEAEGDPKRKTRFADEMQNADGADGSAAAKTKDGQDLNANDVKPLDQIETLSDIADNENAVGDLSDDEPRLILPNLRPVKKSKSKRARDRSSHVPNPQSSSMPQRTRFTPAILTRSPTALEEEFSAPMPTMPPASTMHPLVRIHRKENPRAWKDALGDKANGMESMNMDTAKRQLSENRLKRLLEELYTDKKYFDYVKKTTTDTEQNLMQSADKSLDFLYGRAMFWEEKEPIPERPPSHVKRMFSRYEPSKSPTKSLQRSATILSRNGISRNSVHRAPSTSLATRTPSTRKATRTPSLRQNLRTPSTQVSRLKKREQLDKKKKENLNNASKKTSKYLEDSTQTDFSPIPSITPVEGMAIEGNLEAFDTMSLPRSPGIQIDRLSPVMPLQREVTRADIQLEEYDGQEAEYDDLNRDLRYDNQHIDEGPNAVSAV
ncbi:hypothetical protein DPMN_107358 [Dreissena polymorpha]|uniref:Uncharacterized protein n=1 Tax=Dreissena polymorpha TaxID=45954 RepID=A0A9D4K6S9_DREPO|nr:hypothetical protein DPMN_107358 [Dreissena polymorpha]